MIRPKFKIIALVCGSIASVMIGPRPTDADDIQMRVRWEGSTPLVSFSARELITKDGIRKLKSGLPQTVVWHVLARTDKGDDVLGAAAGSCRIVYDLWEEIYRLDIHTQAEQRSYSITSLDEILLRCLSGKDVHIGGRSSYAPHRNHRVYFAMVAEFNPLSADTVRRIRHWLARSGSSDMDSGAFFGSIVGLFVNRKIGEAEKTVRGQSQRMVVP